jgi:hypothetical protein
MFVSVLPYGRTVTESLLRSDREASLNSLDFQEAVSPKRELFLNSSLCLVLPFKRRSRWPRGLRHEPSSPARKLGSWVRIPLKEWMDVCVCVYSVFVLSCV